jgi:hypothetical protein
MMAWAKKIIPFFINNWESSMEEEEEEVVSLV